MMFTNFIGIDYSGRGTPLHRIPGLQVYAATGHRLPERVNPISAPQGKDRNWCRKEVAEWLLQQFEVGEPFIAGIDHAFSFPVAYFQRNNLSNWDEFLADFVEHWPTDQDRNSVFDLRKGNPRTGTNDEFRLADRWTSSAKSVFHFDIQGQVACSTHAGLSWLRRIKQEAGDRVHFWPFDGWNVPDGRSVIAEVYPSILRKRYPREGRSADQHDAYVVAQWLADMDRRNVLGRYFAPPLSDDERKMADLEGWILGIL